MLWDCHHWSITLSDLWKRCLFFECLLRSIVDPTRWQDSGMEKKWISLISVLQVCTGSPSRQLENWKKAKMRTKMTRKIVTLYLQLKKRCVHTASLHCEPKLKSIMPKWGMNLCNHRRQKTVVQIDTLYDIDVSFNWNSEWNVCMSCKLYLNCEVFQLSLWMSVALLSSDDNDDVEPNPWVWQQTSTDHWVFCKQKNNILHFNLIKLVFFFYFDSEWQFWLQSYHFKSFSYIFFLPCYDSVFPLLCAINNGWQISYQVSYSFVFYSTDTLTDLKFLFFLLKNDELELSKGIIRCYCAL